MYARYVVALSFCFAACASTNPSPGQDGGSSSNSPNAPSSAPGDAGNPNPVTDAAAPPEVVNGCTSFTDMTANGATIQGPMDALPAQYSPNCVHIKMGQTVTWNLFFSGHPMAASGGDTPSPIETTSTGTTVTFTFDAPGTFGFHCLSHPTQMFGAVEVTP
ncbi:MAG TPA: plastocyanin/azurin family copper-binding protein [Polyangiaceae bacterium]|jgi:plastocyanin